MNGWPAAALPLPHNNQPQKHKSHRAFLEESRCDLKTSTMKHNNITKVTRQVQTKTLPIEQIESDPEFQIRESQSQETIDEFAEAMEQKEKFPPIDVVKIGQKHKLADGFHRLAAAKQAGKKEIRARITVGDEDTLLELALCGNSRNGMRLTTADKRRGIEKALRRWSDPKDKSDRAIARMVGCTAPTVGKVRREVLNFYTEPGEQFKEGWAEINKLCAEMLVNLRGMLNAATEIKAQIAELTETDRQNWVAKLPEFDAVLSLIYTPDGEPDPKDAELAGLVSQIRDALQLPEAA
jgi:hypothetical protein